MAKKKISNETEPVELNTQDIPQLVYLPVDRLHPHPDNPRKDLGDLAELAESIKANGILQNLTVVVDDPTSTISDFTVIIGHRRLAAAKLAGLEYAPCVIADLSPKEQIQTMLLENMQRADLTVYEQAQGFQMMLDMGSTVEEISEKSGFSTTTVRRRVKMMELNQQTLKEVSARQLSLGDFDRLAQIEDLEARNKCLEKIGTNDFNMAVASQLRKQVIAARLPAIKKLLEDHNAKAIKSMEQYTSNYVGAGSMIRISETEVENITIPEEIKGTIYYYLDEEYGSLRFYQKNKKSAPVKRSASELEREKMLAAVWKKVGELNAVTHKMRSEFVEGLKVNSKNHENMFSGAISSILIRAINYVGTDKSLIYKTLCLSKTYEPDKCEKALAALGSLAAEGYPKLIYANFDDGEDKSYAHGYKGVWPEYSKNVTLDALYDWLCSLGYEMSEDEKRLQDGSHEVFVNLLKSEEKKDDA